MTGDGRSDRFVVGTGRCGSTLLSRMLACHPGVCSLHECFTGLDWARRFVDGDVTGAYLADVVGTPQDVTTQVLARGYDAEEITYPFRPGDRYRRGDPVPWILLSMLAPLTPDPDSLFDEVDRYLRTLGPAPVAQQYRRLFTWLTQRTGREVWVERSGSSVDYLGDLVRLFPDARFVHLHRDGREAALSMREHPFYRLAVCLLYDAVPAEAADEGADVVTALLESRPPVELFGRYWSDQLTNGLAHADALEPGALLSVSFEDLLARPAATLTRVGAHLELPAVAGEGWVEAAAALVRDPPPPRYPTLSPEERQRLDDACAPGMALLGRA